MLEYMAAAHMLVYPGKMYAIGFFPQPQLATQLREKGLL
jgi:hypothetical protein